MFLLSSLTKKKHGVYVKEHQNKSQTPRILPHSTVLKFQDPTQLLFKFMMILKQNQKASHFYKY